MLFMVIERFKNGDPVPVYRRFREQGRLAPPEVTYINSWVTPDLEQCYQIMEAPSRALLEEWIECWKDLVEFETIQVLTSAEAATAVAPRL